ncbi:MAG TPA: FtsW/RodA/SpoVE family cell cycle protein, partial [Solirubrobacterales bacterium]|nr:FtsW/RodA/SpoVE family cell cycle protein [Solirubrobacterales bacterium]
WSVFDAEALKEKNANKRPLFEAQQIKRGKITTSDGQVIANSTKSGENESYQYLRRYPQGSLFGNPIGYSFITQGTSGFERAENATLTGEENEFVSIVDQIRGQQREGSDIVTTLDASAQQLATDQLEATGRPGAVVAIEPSTGAIRVIPLTGVTLPLISYGGSSVIANMVLVALLLLISDRARRPEPGEAR